MSGNNKTTVIKCKKCNIIYNNRSGLWKHNKSVHGNVDKQHDNQNDKHKETVQKKSYICLKCNHKFVHYQSRWRHEKTCNNTNNNQDIIIKKLDQLTEKINKLENKPTKNSKPQFINNGTIVNGTNNSNKLVINKIGTENVLELNDMEITDIFNKEIEGVIKLIEFVNFNERLHLFLGKQSFPKNKDGL
jgi:hypothetical protein